MFTGLTEQLDFGNHLISEIVPEDNELVKLKKILNWEKMNKIYRECYKSKKGNATKKTDLVLGLFILKHLYSKPYRVIIDELHLNAAYMLFCSVSYDEVVKLKNQKKKLIDHSTLIKIKYRLGEERFQRITKIFLKELIKHGFVDGKYLFSDTTSLEKNILYPTDISLLKRVIEESEAVIQKVRYKKDIVKNEVIKKANSIAKIFYSSSKKTKKLVQEICEKLIEISQNSLEKAAKVVKQKSVKGKKHIINRYKKLYDVGSKIVSQTLRHLDGEKIEDRIVSYFEDHARALPKGKVGRPVEFGDKLRIDMSGNGYITNWELYLGNPADVTMLKDTVKEHHAVFKDQFKAAGLDRGFYDEGKIEDIESEYQIALAIPHKKDRSKKMGKRKEKLYNKRSSIEAKISEGKRMCGLNKSLYKGYDGDLIWTSLSILCLNIRKSLRDIASKPSLIRKFA